MPFLNRLMKLYQIYEPASGGQTNLALPPVQASEEEKSLWEN
jgi:hypothetical protein